ncbi:MAG TPA: AraC family transcriptional regulator [Clostridiales bacterium]|jgi:AraC-like DNA-binding protein|nr:AraC family transcriptional regulator [Clostridiales bacterium]
MDKYCNGFLLTPMKKEINVSHFVTFHYFEYPHMFIFEGERHNFWELLYVDKGVVFSRTDTEHHQLQQGQIIFHKPGEFHSVECNGVISPCLVVISFVCTSPAMKFFENKVLPITSKTKSLMSFIISEAKKTYATDLSDPYYKRLDLDENCPLGSQQLIKNYFEAFLLELLRHNSQNEKNKTILSTSQINDRRIRFEMANAYLQEHLSENLTLSDVCDHCSMSKSLAQQIFKLETGNSVMQWYTRLRIEQAKQRIREGKGNMTTIANQLGYSSIHHFSKQFSKVSGKSPTEYAQSITSLLNVDRELF